MRILYTRYKAFRVLQKWCIKLKENSTMEVIADKAKSTKSRRRNKQSCNTRNDSTEIIHEFTKIGSEINSCTNLTRE